MKVEYPNCNLCGSKSFGVVWNDVTTWEHPGRFRVVRCNKCGLVFLNPRPTEEHIKRFYSKEGYWGRDLEKDTLPVNWKEERKWRYGPLYRGIFKRRKKGSILDIGAGTGMFLSKFKETGWQVQGTEFSMDVAQFAKRSFSIHLKVGDFLKLKFEPKRFDVVTITTVLEHVYKPKETLRKIHRILKPGGLLVVTVPNIDSIGAKIFRSEWYALDPPRHLYQFSVKTLEKMLNQAGFKIQDISHDYWAHNYYHLFESLRFILSPRFKKRKTGGLVHKGGKKKFSLVKEIGKILAKTFAFIVASLEPIVRRGEVIIVYARKI